MAQLSPLGMMMMLGQGGGPNSTAPSPNLPLSSLFTASSVPGLGNMIPGATGQYQSDPASTLSAFSSPTTGGGLGGLSGLFSTPQAQSFLFNLFQSKGAIPATVQNPMSGTGAA